MTNLQLVLTIAIPSLLVLVGIFLNNARFNGIDARFGGVDARFNTIEGRFNGIEARLIAMEAELRQFYRDLGRHEADIINIKERNRS
ncbi:MAG: hypothetical protein ACRD3N_07800 [Terracidiphilus sp.]